MNKRKVTNLKFKILKLSLLTLLILMAATKIK